jgi:hypothetical protein
MFDCSGDILAYHDQDVTLPQAERDGMRSRRDANRKRLKDGLIKRKKALPTFHSQGSYAMKTMLQEPGKDYDIDDGVYFESDDLVGDRGAPLSALDARKLVRDALDDGSFTTPPQVRKNCVRAIYAAGYHVDLPVYRRVVEEGPFTTTEWFELAGSDWVRSDARDVTAWFDARNQSLSPDAVNGRQMRRTTRLAKRFARSRDSWKGSILSGFGVTVLIAGHDAQPTAYRSDAAREDRALYETMRAVRDQLNRDLVVRHPCTPGATVTKGQDDPRARFLRDKLDQALEDLDILFAPDCTRAKALKAWGKVFNTDFFERRVERAEASAATAIFSPGTLRAKVAAEPRAPVRKEGGGRSG